MPAAAISSSCAGRSSAAPTAFASGTSLSSMSPRTIASTSLSGRSSPWKPAISITALAVADSGTPRNSLSAAMVLTPGVATSSSGAASPAAAALPKFAISRFAA